VVADGRMKINARTRSVLAALGVYQEGVGKNVVNGKPVVCLYLPIWEVELTSVDCASIRVHNSAYVVFLQLMFQLTRISRHLQ
jgi:hypothetical protein